MKKAIFLHAHKHERNAKKGAARMKDYVDWILAHPSMSVFIVFLMLSKPLSHVVTPQLVSRISINIKDGKSVRRLFTYLILTGLALFVMEILTVMYQPVFASMFARDKISESFSRVLQSPKGTDEDQTTYIAKLMMVHQNVNDIIGMASAVVAGQVFSAVAALYIFFTRAPGWFSWTVTIGLVTSSVLLMMPGGRCIERVKAVNRYRNELMSDISDTLASSHMVDPKKEAMRTAIALEEYERVMEVERWCRRRRLVISMAVSTVLTVGCVFGVFYLHKKKLITSNALIELLGISLSLFEVQMRSYDYVTVLTRVMASVADMNASYNAGIANGAVRRNAANTDGGISVSRLRVPFTDGTRVSFEVPPGAVYCIVGPNACGKSRLLKALAGQVELPDEADVGHADLPAGSVYFPQNAWLLDRTIEENVGVTDRAKWVGALRDIGLVQEANNLDQAFSTSDRVGKKGYRLSGGQRQILWLTRVLSNQDAKCLLMDEPTSSMSASAVQKAARAIATSGKTILLVSHDVELQKQCHAVLEWADITVS